MAVEKKKDRTEAMAEEEPNQNVPDNGSAEMTPRWGPQHAGAKELASQYTFGNASRFFLKSVVLFPVRVRSRISTNYSTEAHLHYYTAYS